MSSLIEIPTTVEDLIAWRGLSKMNRIKIKLACRVPAGRQAIEVMLAAIKISAMEFKEKNGREPTKKEEWQIVSGGLTSAGASTKAAILKRGG